MAVKNPAKKLPPREFFASSLFHRLYLVFALIVLAATAVYWAILGAKLESGNADQLVDPQLFKSIATFRGATFPGAHSLLIKWPIFWLANLFGSTSAVIETLTVILVVLTLGAAVVLIYKIDRRPLVFGTICLALSSVLLLVPIAPYAGALLPVNMAMLTTRNIEYIVLILSLILLIKSPRIRSLGFVLAAVVLSLLVASDKLFLIMCLGGGLIALIVYAKSKTAKLANLAVNLIVLSLAAAIGSYIVLAIVGASGLTHLSGVANASPYGLASSAKDLALGVIYGILGILTNFGANPAYAATEVKNIPSQIFDHLFSFAGPGYLINFIILLVGLFVVYKLVLSSWYEGSLRKKTTPNIARALSVLLIWISVAALASYIVTSHYYAVDARYLTIFLFTIFICFATYSRARVWRPEVLAGAGAVITIGIIFGVIGATKSYNADQAALAFQNSRNTTVSQVLSEHHDKLLVGNYWRVVPIKQDNIKNLTVSPLDSCTDPQSALDSSTWQPNLNKTKFVYLLTLKGNLTNYPNCSLKQVVSAYGRPNNSALISGTLNNPNELLLFYDHGIHHSAPSTPQPPNGPATVVPISPALLPFTSCSVPSVVNVVAHEDDDLLFMNPDILNDIKAGNCVRTVYVTSGSAGSGKFYWLGREDGSEAAYSYMLHASNIWVQRIVELAPNEFITVANPKGNSKVSLIFMHLPDGNLKGEGFASSGYQSLQKLRYHQISTINSVDHQSYYSYNQLVSAISEILNIYQPSEINTQASLVGDQFPEHSDHLFVNWFVRQAYASYETQKYDNKLAIPINFFEGYPGRQSPANVSDGALQQKEAAFLAYAKYDPGVCQTLQQCLQTHSYDGYLTRQIQYPD